MADFGDTIDLGTFEKRRDIIARENVNTNAIIAQRGRVQTKRDNFRADPSKLDKSIFNFMVRHVPDDINIASEARKVPLKTDAIEASFSDSNPMKGMATEIKRTVNQYMDDPRFSHMAPGEIIESVYKGNLAKRKENIHQFAYDNKNSPFRIFPGPSENIRELPDQEAWEAANPQNSYNSAATSFLMGAAGHVVIAGVGAGLTALGVLATAPVSVPTLAGAAAVSGALAIPGFLAYDKIVNEIDDTDFAKENPGLATVAKHSLALVGAAGVERGIAKVFSKAGATMMSKVAAEKVLAKDPSAEALLNFTEAYKVNKNAVSKYTTQLKHKAQSTIARSAKREIKVKDDLRSVLHQVVDKDRLNISKVKAYEEFYKGPSKSETIAINLAKKKFGKRHVKDYDEVINQVETGVAKDMETAHLNINMDRAITKDMAKDVNVLAEVSKGNIKGANKARSNVKDVMEANGQLKVVVGNTPKQKNLKAKETKAVQKATEKTLTEKTPQEIQIQINIKQRQLDRLETNIAIDKRKIQKAFKGKDKRKIVETSPTVTEATKVVDSELNRLSVNPVVSSETSKIDLATGSSNIKTMSEISSEMPKPTDPQFETWVKTLEREERVALVDKLGSEYKDAGIKESGKALRAVEKINDKIRREALAGIDDIAKNEAPLITGGSSEVSASIRNKISTIEEHSGKVTELKRKEILSIARKSGEPIPVTQENITALDNLIEKIKKFDIASASKLLTGIAGVTGVVSMLSPDAAEASPISGAVKFGEKVAMPYVKKIIGSAMKENEANALKLAKDMYSLKRVVDVPTKNTIDIGNHIMAAADANVATTKDIVSVKPLPWVIENLASPHTVAQHYLGRTKKGVATYLNPVVQYLGFDTAAKVNITHTSQIFTQMMKRYGIESDAINVAKRMTPFVEKYDLKMNERAVHQAYLRDHKNSLSQMYNKLKRLDSIKLAKKSAGENTSNATRKINEQIASIEAFEKRGTELAQNVKSTDEMYQSYVKEWNTEVQAMAKDSPSVRVYLASSDYNKLERFPWLKPMMKENELKAVNHLKLFNENYGLRLLEVNEKVITHRPFIHQPLHPKSDINKLEKSLQDTFGAGYRTTPAMVRFHSRSAERLPMMPETAFAMQKYIPDAEMRLASKKFWRGPEGTGEGGWERFMKSDTVQGTEGLKKFFDKFQRGMLPVDKTGIQRMAEVAYAVEVGRLLAFSASVPFKHSLKVIGDLRVFGVDGAKAIPEASGVFWRNRARAVGLDMPKGQYDDTVLQWTNTGNMINTIADIDVGRIPDAAWERGLQSWNKWGGMPTAMVESFDRGLSVIASLNMAAKQGMSADHAMYATMDTILKTNFISGSMNPAWLRDPITRFFLMFQGTPFKLLEQKIITGVGAGRSVSEATKVLMEQLRATMKTGENQLKGSMILDALNMEKDIFGTSISRQAARQITTMGGVLMAGKTFIDSDLTSHLFHLPFAKIEPGTKAPTPQLSPVPAAIYKTAMNRGKEDVDFWLSDFFNNWFSKKGPWPINFLKAARLTRGDIPDIYRNSELNYLFSVPKAGKK